jgi:hypothetical protein
VSLPVAVAAFTAFGLAGRLTVGVVVVSVLLGVAYNLVPLAWLACIGCWRGLLGRTGHLRRAADLRPVDGISRTAPPQHHDNLKAAGRS